VETIAAAAVAYLLRIGAAVGGRKEFKARKISNAEHENYLRI